MADVTLTSVPDLITELVGRAEFKGVVLSIDATAETAAPSRGRNFSGSASAALPRPQLSNLLAQAAGRVESSGSL